MGGAGVDSPPWKTDTFFFGHWECQFINNSNQVWNIAVREIYTKRISQKKVYEPQRTEYHDREQPGEYRRLRVTNKSAILNPIPHKDKFELKWALGKCILDP